MTYHLQLLFFQMFVECVEGVSRGETCGWVYRHVAGHKVSKKQMLFGKVWIMYP